jgi:hypothetical protein
MKFIVICSPTFFYMYVNLFYKEHYDLTNKIYHVVRSVATIAINSLSISSILSLYD